jgi:hypothetical protein
LSLLSFYWSGKRDSNPRPSAWEADALPLSYFRPLYNFFTPGVSYYTPPGPISQEPGRNRNRHEFTTFLSYKTVVLYTYSLPGKQCPAAQIKTQLFPPGINRVGPGAAGRNRTTDTRIFSPLLYRLSYRGKTTGQHPLQAADPNLAELTGIEPAISGLTGRHVNRYTTAPKKWWAKQDLNL